MRQIGFIAAALMAAATGAISQDNPTLFCLGHDPNWELDLLGNQAQLRFAEQTIDFDVPQSVTAEGGKPALAMTLLNASNTAVVVLENEICTSGGADFTHEIQVLTQRRSLPILMSGCCRAPG